MWTDSRYWLAGANELYEGWELMKLGKDKFWWEWADEQLKDSDRKVFGFDFSQYDCTRFEIRKKFLDGKGITLKSVENLVDIVWGNDRPVRP